MVTPIPKDRKFRLLMLLIIVVLIPVILIQCSDKGGGDDTPDPVSGPNPILIENINYTAEMSKVALSTNGDAVALWRQRDAMGNYDIYANRFNALTGAWGAATAIENNTTDVTAPQIGMDGNGNAIALWLQKGDAPSTLYTLYANRHNGTNWGTPRRIDTGNATDHGESGPQLAVFETGEALAVWRQDTSGGGLWFSRFEGGNWSAPTRIETFDQTGGGAYNASRQRLAFERDGGSAMLVWADSCTDCTGYHIWASRYSGGSWVTATQLDTDTPKDVSAYYPVVGMNSLGEGMIVWDQWENNTSTNRYLKARYFNGASWGTATRISAQEIYSSEKSFKVAVSGDSSMMVIANTQVDGSNGLWASRYSGESWGTFVQLSEGRTPHIRMDSSGNAMAVWGAYSNVTARSYTAADSGWRTAEAIGGYIVRVGNLAMTPNGKAIAIWEQADNLDGGTINSIWVNHYTPASGWR